MSAATWLPSVLRTAGLTVKTYDGWKNRGRPGSFAPFAVDLHHTGTPTSMSNPAPTVGFCISGSAALAGPLCQVVIGYDGVCHVIAAGRANHAGTNDGTGTGPVPAGDGNAQMIGFEIDYSGSQDMGPAQYDAAVRAAAAVVEHFKHDQSYVRGHKETSSAGKWDPGRKGSSSPEYLMDDIRRDVRAVLGGDVGEEDEMAIKQGDKGTDVEHIQLALNNWSAHKGKGWKVQQDGTWGTGGEMTGRVKEFQKAYDLKQTGEVDGLTAAFLLRFDQPRYWQ